MLGWAASCVEACQSKKLTSINIDLHITQKRRSPVKEPAESLSEYRRRDRFWWGV